MNTHEHTDKEVTCKRRHLDYCREMDTKCDFLGREFGCAFYRHDLVDKEMERRISEYNKEIESWRLKLK
jgi:hypothetical protein